MLTEACRVLVISHIITSVAFVSSALTYQEQHLACKNWVLLSASVGYLSGVTCQ